MQKALILSLIIYSSLVYSEDYLTGIRVNHGTTTVAPSISGHLNSITNNSAIKDYFVPTKTDVEWTSILNNHPSDLVFTDLGSTYKSCSEIKDAYPNAVDGPYMIDANLDGTPVPVYCDMTIDGGGWTLVFKSIGSDRTDSFSANSSTSYWLNPAAVGDARYLSNETAFVDSVYKNVNVQEFLIRSINDPSKYVAWSQGSNSENLKTMINNKLRMPGVLFAGSTASLDYRSGCTVGTTPSTQYFGIYPGDDGSVGDPGHTVYFLNNATYLSNTWLGALIGWGSGSADYSSGTALSGGFGARNHFGNDWNFTRHVHGIGNGCNATEWGASGNVGSQTMNGHALFVRSGSFKKSCKEILDDIPEMPSGIYTIKPSSTAFQVYCDMTNDGGGWTLIVRAIANTYDHRDANAVGTLSSPIQSSAYKLSDAVINTIPFTMYRGQTDSRSSLAYFDTSDTFKATATMNAKSKPTYAGATWYGPFYDSAHIGLNNYQVTTGAYNGETTGPSFTYTDSTLSGCRKGFGIASVADPGLWCGTGYSGSIWVK